MRPSPVRRTNRDDFATCSLQPHRSPRGCTQTEPAPGYPAIRAQTSGRDGRPAYRHHSRRARARASETTPVDRRRQ